MGELAASPFPLSSHLAQTHPRLPSPPSPPVAPSTRPGQHQPTNARSCVLHIAITCMSLVFRFRYNVVCHPVEAISFLKMDSAGGIKAKAMSRAKKQHIQKRPAMAIASFPARSPVRNALPARSPMVKAPPGVPARQLWHGGPPVQKPWLKKVQKAHMLCRGAIKAGLMAKAPGYKHGFQAGIPPPPMAAVLHSLSLMAQWNARWQDKHVTSKDWRSERNTVMVAGRPVGIIIVSHQAASPIEWDSYHNLIWHPLRPVILFGPTGLSVQDPKMQCKFTVIQWWKVFVFYRELQIKREDAQARPPPKPQHTQLHSVSTGELAASLRFPLRLASPLASPAVPPAPHLASPPLSSAPYEYLKTVTRKLACRL